MGKFICPECGKGYTGTRCRHCGWETFSEQTVSPKPTVAKNRKKRIHPLIGFLLLLALIAGNSKNIVRKVIAWAAAAVAKFAALYAIVVGLICGVLAENLLAAGTLKEPMLKALPATFSWPQLITALIGGAIALLIVPVLRKALKK